MQNALLNAYRAAAQAPIEEAQCLPFAVYHDPLVYQLEVDQVFHNDWVFACAADKLADAGDYFAFDLAGEQVALIVTQTGSLKALSNICRHRGTALLDLGFGKLQKNIVCPYHAWTYNDSGELLGVPLPGNCKIDKSQHHLPSFQLHNWQGLLFINLSSSAQPFCDKVAKLEKYLAMFDLARFKHSYQTPAEHWNTNWKLAVENAIESYHLFKVHKETLEQFTPTKLAYYVAGNATSSLSGGSLKNTQSSVMKWLIGKTPEAYNHYLLLFLPPSFIAIITVEGINWIQVMPNGEGQCSVIPGGLAQAPIKNFNSAEFQFTDAFMLEDKIICERVQKSMHARKAQGGKLVEMERILADFHQYLAKQLFATPTNNFYESEQSKIFAKD